MMEKYFGILSYVIESELKRNHEIAIFPMGKVGTYARFILETRYGCKGIYIDNFICTFNESVVNIEDFCEYHNDKDVSVIICLEDADKNTEFVALLKGMGFNGNIRNCLEKTINENTDREDEYAEIKELCKVKKAIDYELIRIGKKGDGGYVMLNDFEGVNTAYSFGLGNEISWELDMVEKGIQVQCYDPFIESLPQTDERMIFHKCGISGENDPSENMMTMEEILKENSDLENDELILKMDVEGAEWDFIDQTQDEVLRQFKQITFEMHGLITCADHKRIIDCLKRIRKTHTPVWIHANNVGKVEKGMKTIIPDLLEVTFVRNDCYTLLDTRYDCPIELDYPNKNRYLEVELKGFGSLDR